MTGVHRTNNMFSRTNPNIGQTGSQTRLTPSQVSHSSRRAPAMLTRPVGRGFTSLAARVRGSSSSRPVGPIEMQVNTRHGAIKIVSNPRLHVVTTQYSKQPLPFALDTLQPYERGHNSRIHINNDERIPHRHQVYHNRDDMMRAIGGSVYNDEVRRAFRHSRR